MTDTEGAPAGAGASRTKVDAPGTGRAAGPMSLFSELFEDALRASRPSRARCPGADGPCCPAPATPTESAESDGEAHATPDNPGARPIMTATAAIPTQPTNPGARIRGCPPITHGQPNHTPAGTLRGCLSPIQPRLFDLLRRCRSLRLSAPTARQSIPSDRGPRRVGSFQRNGPRRRGRSRRCHGWRSRPRR